MIEFQVNGNSCAVEVPPEMPLLWVLRDELGLKGTKYGCGIAQCGACTVLFNGTAMRSCQLPAAALAGAQITTIEGMGTPEKPHPIQQAWVDLQVAQCGYCQSGQIMQAASLLSTHPDPNDEDIDRFMAGNLCRCGAYPRIREALKLAAKRLDQG